MSRHNLSLPVSFIITFAALAFSLFFGTPSAPDLSAQANPCNPADPNQPCISVFQSYPGPTNTPTQATSTPTSTVPPTSTPTATATVFTTPSPSPSPIPTPTRFPTATRVPVTVGPSPTPTSPIPPGVETLVCFPGATITLVGSAPPQTALVVYFNKRPVGGGFSRADGVFNIDLVIGPERPGLYLVEVQERGTRAQVALWGCEVPHGTLTPTSIAVTPTSVTATPTPFASPNGVGK